MHSPVRSGNGPGSSPTPNRPAFVLDAILGGLFMAVAVWMYWARTRSGGSAGSGIALLTGCGLVIMAARAVGRRGRLIVPAAAFAAAVAVAVGSGASVTSSRALAGPLGYLNANGALYVQAAIAGLMLAAAARSVVLRAIGGAGALAFAVLPFVVHALAAACLVVLAPGIALLLAGLGGPRGARLAPAVFAGLFAAALATTVALGAGYSASAQPDAVERTASSTLDRVRLALWHDALRIMREHPLDGVGPSRFQQVSPIAIRDRDSRWAHNEFLQQGAEGGVIGLVLLVGLFGCGFARLFVVRAPDAVTALAAGSLAALAIHASIDYVMHFPAIPLMTAGLVATGMIEEHSPLPRWGRWLVERHDLEQTTIGA